MAYALTQLGPSLRSLAGCVNKRFVRFFPEPAEPGFLLPAVSAGEGISKFLLPAVSKIVKHRSVYKILDFLPSTCNGSGQAKPNGSAWPDRCCCIAGNETVAPIG
jgi:hypothetical protein